MTKPPKIVGTGMLNDLARIIFGHLEELQEEVRSITPKASRGVAVYRTAVGTTFTAKAVEETSTTAPKAGPARWS